MNDTAELIVLDDVLNLSVPGNCNIVSILSIDTVSTTSILQGILFGIIIFLAFTGNLLVIVSVLRTKTLRRKYAYYFVVSLALADLLVSVGAMVFNAIKVIHNGHWFFGLIVCDVFNAMDVIFSTSSILHLFCISLYRWFQIVRSPESWNQYFTKSVVIILILSCWVVSFIIGIVPIYANIYTTQEFLENRMPCRCDFVVNRGYAVVSSSVSFWLPTAGIVYFYYQIMVCAIEKHKADIKHQIRRSTYSTGSGLTQISNGTQSLIDPLAVPGSSSRASYSSGSQMGTLSRTVNISPAVERNESLRENINAAKTLLIILVVYIVCWFPFFLTYIIDAFLHVCPPVWVTFVFWLGYLNSAINPFIYAVKFKEFKPAFLDTLRCLGLCTCCKDDLRNLNNYSTNIYFRGRSRDVSESIRPSSV